MSLFISLIVIISQCTCASKHYTAYLKYVQSLFINYTSKKAGGKSNTMQISQENEGKNKGLLSEGSLRAGRIRNMESAGQRGG